MPETNALPAAVAAFIPHVDAFNREFNRGGFAWAGSPPNPTQVADAARRREELLAEIARTGDELVRLLIRGARSDNLAVDLRQFLNALAANDLLPLSRDWGRLKAALQVAAEQSVEPSAPPDSDRFRAIAARCNDLIETLSPGFVRNALEHIPLTREAPRQWATVGIDEVHYRQLEECWAAARRAAVRVGVSDMPPELPAANILTHAACNFLVALGQYCTRLADARQSEELAVQDSGVTIIRGPGFRPGVPEDVSWTVRQLLRWTEETARRKSLPKERRYPRDVDLEDTFATADRYLRENAPEYYAWLQAEWPRSGERPVLALLYIPSPDKAPGYRELRTHAFALYRTDFTPETIRAMIGDLARALRQTADDVMAMTLDRAAAAFDSLNEPPRSTATPATGTGAPTGPSAEVPRDPDTVYTVAAARDLLRFRRENAARRQAVFDPNVLKQVAFPVFLHPLEKVKLALQLADPKPSQMPEQAAVASAVFALLVDAARRESGRELDEDALAAMVSHVAIQSDRLPADVWPMTLAEFGRLKWPDLFERREKIMGKNNPTSETNAEGESPLEDRDQTPLTLEKLGDAKRAILQVLANATEAMQNSAIASKAGYTSGTLRHHYGELQAWKLVESTKDGYIITPAGRAVILSANV